MAKQQQTTTVLHMMICCAAWKPDKPSGNDNRARLEFMITADQHAHHKHINPANWLLQSPYLNPSPCLAHFPPKRQHSIQIQHRLLQPAQSIAIYSCPKHLLAHQRAVVSAMGLARKP